MEVSGQLHALAVLPPRESPPVPIHGVVLIIMYRNNFTFFTHRIGGWVGPKVDLDAVGCRKVLPLPGIEPNP
jgi:hypothetical protein